MKTNEKFYNKVLFLKEILNNMYKTAVHVINIKQEREGQYEEEGIIGITGSDNDSICFRGMWKQ